MRISFFKKVSLYFTFRKILLNNEFELKTQFNARIDNVSRIYTVLNVPKELIEEPYNLRTADIDNLSQKFIKEYSSNLSKYLDSKGLTELYTYYDSKKVDKYSYLLIFGFSLFESNKYASRLLKMGIPLLLILIMILFYIF
jgi:hypothetical protein